MTPHTCLALAGRPKPGLQGPRALVLFLFAGLLTALGDAVTGLILLDNSRLQFLFLFAGLLTALGDAVTGLILLDNSWLQSLIAGALGVITRSPSSATRRRIDSAHLRALQRPIGQWRVSETNDPRANTSAR